MSSTASEVRCSHKVVGIADKLLWLISIVCNSLRSVVSVVILFVSSVGKVVSFMLASMRLPVLAESKIDFETVAFDVALPMLLDLLDTISVNM